MIKLIDLKKRFDTKWITRGVNLEIPTGEITCIIGRSGEGKSVLLKQVIGLLRPTEGHIIIDGVDTTKLTDAQLEENFKKFGYVFQFAALLDSLTVFENVGIVDLEQGVSQDKVLPLVKEKLAMVNLREDVLHKYPAQISGGQRKRVGLARTLMLNPKILLYDEPTTGLDPITVRIVHELIVDMHKKLGVTSVIISHDVEVFKYVDKVALLHDGKIRFFGDAATIWESDNEYIHQFIRGIPEGPIQTEIVHTKVRV